MPDLNFQDISTVGSDKSPKPVTITAAASITPTTFLTFITGTTALATIVPPVSGAHMLAIVALSTNWAGALTTGNIIVASITNGTTWANRANFFVYDPLTAKYYPQYAVLTTTAP